MITKAALALGFVGAMSASAFEPKLKELISPVRA